LYYNRFFFPWFNHPSISYFSQHPPPPHGLQTTTHIFVMKAAALWFYTVYSSPLFSIPPPLLPHHMSRPIHCHTKPCAGIFKQSVGARNRVEIGLSYRPARALICKHLRSPEIDSARQIGNRFMGSLKSLQLRAQATQPGVIVSLESILGLFKSLKIWALFPFMVP
jgi:hypothetical protein